MKLHLVLFLFVKFRYHLSLQNLIHSVQSPDTSRHAAREITVVLPLSDIDSL